MLGLLFCNENADLLCESINFCGLEILIDGNQNAEHAEHIVGSWLRHVAQKLFDVSVGSQEDLHLCADGKISDLTALLHE